MITEELKGILAEFKKGTTHKVKFYSKNSQFWFKNDTTGREYPLPIALIEKITTSETQPEENRIARLDLKTYVESTHSAKS